MVHQELERWVREVEQHTRPDRVAWCDGSEEESRRINQTLVEQGTFIPLSEKQHPNSFYARSHPSDVARVEDRTFICSTSKADAGPTNNWMSPAEMQARLKPLFAECMRGRTMYVIPYLMGPPGSPISKVGVEITDSAYVVANMRIMTHMGKVALDELGSDGAYVKGLHSTGKLDPAERYIAHFPDEHLIMSYSSNYGGNALLGKKCFALRLASVLARDEGWLAEHMLIVGITDPSGKQTYIAAAFPSACGKTNLALMNPPERMRAIGWKVETVGDDIAWMKFGPDGRLRAINPEFGFFGVAPGTNEKTNPNALASCRSNSIFTNVALTDDGNVWWEGLSAPPEECTDWLGNRWRAATACTPAAHPNSRFTAPASQCPSISADWQNPAGVPISAIIFGGRRASAVPLVFECNSWQHGTYVGATLSSERTAAAAGKIGELRHDPMAMVPFCGYHMADYWRHWLALGKVGGSKMPQVFHVNWFRKDEQGNYLWPGFGENMRVLEWIIGRCQGRASAVETPIGLVPAASALDLEGLNLPASSLEKLFEVNRDLWRQIAAERTTYFQQFGDRLPPEIQAENDLLVKRLESY